jgi:DNA-binding MarR family transcriptional regulator
MTMADDMETLVDIGVLSDLVGYHLRRATNVAIADFARAVGDSGMRQVLFGVLSIVERNPDINQGAVGRSLGIKRANMVALINELVEGGLLDRRVSTEDRRAFALRLTAKGRRVYEDSLARIREHEAALLADFTAEERALFIAMLSRVEANER